MCFRYVFESSGVSIKNENWAQSPTVQPDNLSKFEHCVHIYGTDGFWYDELCNIKKYFVCEDMNNDILFWRTCPLTWDLINKKCYHKASSNTVSCIIWHKKAQYFWAIKYLRGKNCTSLAQIPDFVAKGLNLIAPLIFIQQFHNALFQFPF